MIETNKTVGELHLKAFGIKVTPELSRSGFLKTPIGKASKVSVRNEPFCSFSLPSFQAFDRYFFFSLWFNGEVLTSVHFSTSKHPKSGSWDEYSKEAELDLKNLHSSLLSNEIGLPEGKYEWGSVLSVFDGKAGFSQVVINYKIS